MSKNEKIYYENFKDAVDRNRKKIPSVHKKLKNAGVKYVLSSWIDLHGIPKSKPVPMSDFEPLCLGKGHNLLCTQYLLFQNLHLQIPIK